MSTRILSGGESAHLHLGIVRGSPTDDEVAALAAVLRVVLDVAPTPTQDLHRRPGWGSNIPGERRTQAFRSRRPGW